jgi:hypothetical protein
MPLALMLASDPELVCTGSPEKMAIVLATLVPLIQVAPLAYSMAALVSAAKVDAESTNARKQLRKPRVQAGMRSP